MAFTLQDGMKIAIIGAGAVAVTWGEARAGWREVSFVARVPI